MILAYDPDTRMLGGITSVYDARTQTWVAITDAIATQLAGPVDLINGKLVTLQNFVPATFFAVTVR